MNRHMEWSLYRVAVPFVTPKRWSKGVAFEACRLVLRLNDGRSTGWGEGPDSESTWQALRHGLARGVAMEDQAASAVAEMAMLDLRARRAGVPARSLIRDPVPGTVTVPAVGYVFWDEVPAMVSLAGRLTADGYRHLKIKVGVVGDLRRDLAALLGVRSVVGADVRVVADPNEAWSLDELLPVLTALVELDVAVEQPFHRADEAAHARLREAGVELIADEAALTVPSALSAIGAGVYGAVLVNPLDCGALAHVATVVAAARAAGMAVGLRAWDELGIATAALLEVQAAHRLELPFDTELPYLSHTLTTGRPAVHDGTVAPGEGPGWDVIVDEVALARFTVRTHGGAVSRSLLNSADVRSVPEGVERPIDLFFDPIEGNPRHLDN